MLSSRSARPSSLLVPSLAALACLALAGCSGSADAADGPKPEAKTMRLDAQISATDKALVIQYMLTNDGSSMVVAFNGIPAKDAPSIPKVDPNAVYVTVQDGVVQISKRVFAKPKDAGSAPAAMVRGTALVGGESVTERVTVPLPLQGRSPYGQADRDSVTLPAPVTKVQFCVGAALQNELTSHKPSTQDADTRLAYDHGSQTAGRQVVTCSPVAALAS